MNDAKVCGRKTKKGGGEEEKERRRIEPKR